MSADAADKTMDGPGSAPANTSARYREMVERLFTLSRGGMKLGLGNVARALAALGHPELSYPAVHVAGSNGKGSTCAFLSAILAAHGHRVGLYTSPHLVSFTERVRFEEGTHQDDIAPDELLAAVDTVEAIAPGFESLSFFEVTTLAALVAFERRNIDIAVVEAGLGARLDATRLVDAEVTVLTDLSLEHTAILGDTIEEIAREEGAVIRSERPVVLADGPPAAMAVIDQLVARAHAMSYRIGEDIDVVAHDDGRFDLDLGDRRLEDVTLSLLGRHQRRNALLAAKAATLIVPHINEATLRAGLSRATWPGRMEILEESRVLLDGAHNQHGAEALAVALKDHRARLAGPLHFIFGTFHDKPVHQMLAALEPHVASIVFTRPASPRAWAPKDLAALWPRQASHTEDVVEALALAQKRAAEDGGWVVVCGSLYLVGDVRTLLNAANLRRFSAQ